MTKTDKVLSSDQQCFLEFPDGSLDIRREISNAISSSLKKAKVSRYHVAGRISELVGREITKTTLDNWAGVSHDGHQPPADVVPAFCIATGSYELMDVFASFTGGTFARGDDATYLKMAKKQAEVDRVTQELQDIKKELKL